MKTYVIVRVCNLHTDSECGPPVCIYYDKRSAEDRLHEWKRTNPWDVQEYIIRPMEIRAIPDALQKVITDWEKNK